MSLMSVTSNVSTMSKPNDFNSKDFVFCLTKKLLMNNKELMAAIKSLNPEYTIAETDDEILHLAEERRKYFFICESFHNNLFKVLKKRHCRICAPPFLVYIHNRKRSIPETSRPLFNGSMFGVAVCFTGFATKRDAVSQLADLVHYMGGSVRKDFSGKITHVVANLAQGQKYKAAVNLGKNIMTEQWILQAWNNRNDPFFKATNKEYVDEHQMKPFHGLKLSLLGFSTDESKHMEELTKDNGGTYIKFGEPGCTHLVIEDSYNSLLPVEMMSSVNVVKQEWFWASIQLDACVEESLYFYISELGTPIGTGTQRTKKKRKLLNISDISDLLSPSSPFAATGSKRRSCEGRLSAISSATFDSPVGESLSESNFESPDVRQETPKKALTKRHQTCLELQQTERNYVDVLRTIIKIFKEPIEASANQRGGALLAQEEIKTIFGAIPELLESHEKLLGAVDICINNWSEEQLVGRAICDCAETMMKAYPSFVNYFEMIKETIVTSDKEKPRFHAFLKLCLTKPDCGRQSLTELLIRPVQRLPSLSLLLNDIKKQTSESNPDYPYLIKAAAAIKNVLTHINEDKRKTEHQVQMFEIIRDVDNCPPYLLSSNRSLVSKMDVVEVSENLVVKYDHMTMFLFNDSIEIAKKKNRGVGNTVTSKSPAIQNIQRGGNAQQKAYKHVEFVQLVHLKSVVDIKDDEDHHEMFGLIYHCNNEEKDKFSIFKLMENSSTTKADWMMKIVTCLTQTKCTVNNENFLVTVDPCELINERIDTSDMKDRSGSITKAIKKAKGGFGKKMIKAFNLNKTVKDHKHPLRRAMSSITPINELDVTPSTPIMGPSTPMLTSPTPSEYTIMDFSVCEDK